LNHAYTALHNFDSAKLKSLTEQATLMANSISEGKVSENMVSDGKAVRVLHGNVDVGTVSQGKLYEDKGAESEMAILRARIEASENAQEAEVESDGLISWWAHDAEDCKVVDPAGAATSADIADGSKLYDGTDLKKEVLDGAGYADEQLDEVSTDDAERDSEEEQQQGGSLCPSAFGRRNAETLTALPYKSGSDNSSADREADGQLDGQLRDEQLDGQIILSKGAAVLRSQRIEHLRTTCATLLKSAYGLSHDCDEILPMASKFEAASAELNRLVVHERQDAANAIT
jgi:hypothetical protein